MRVLVACEFSGTVRDAFLKRGHDAMSCDLLPTESPGPHYCGDVLDVIDGWKQVITSSDCTECDCCEDAFCVLHDKHFHECFCYGPTDDRMEYKIKNRVLFARPRKHKHWDLMIAHPPCTYLCSSGLHWNKRVPGRDELTEQALEFVKMLMDAPIDRIAMENPIGRIGTAIRPADQIIQPWQFGHDASKQTALWLKNLPLLKPTKIIEPRIVNGKKRWANQTDGGQNKLGPSDDRWKLRSVTYEGIAKAMAKQWGGLK